LTDVFSKYFSTKSGSWKGVDEEKQEVIEL
jgi:hypothetical protein